MANFAKLFEVEDGEQLLVVRGTNEDDNPEVRFTIEHEGMRVSIAPSWVPTEDMDEDACHAAADQLFKEYDHSMAQGQRERMIAMVDDLAGD